MTTHIIVTGAYGLIGSNFCKTIPEDWKVTKIKFDELSLFTEQADYIVHGAGYGQPGKFLEDEVGTLKVNTETTLKLFEYYLKPGGKFLYLSSSEVYSGLSSAPFKEEEIGTTSPHHPRACYIEGKRSGEAICHAFRRFGADAKIARVSLVYGEGTKKGDKRVLNQFIEQAITENKIELRDSGVANRTYCYIDDAVKMMWDILLNGKDIVYNLGGFSTTTIADLAKTIGRLTGAKVIIPKVKGMALKDAPKDVRLDMNKTCTEFNYDVNSFVGLEEGLTKTIAWQKSLWSLE